MADSQQSSSGSTKVVVLKDMSDEDAVYIASWMSKAFYRRDPFAYLHCGVSYSVDPDLHDLFFRAIRIRASICGKVLTTPERTAACMLFCPGDEIRHLDPQWRSGRDDAFDEFIKRAGGIAAIQARTEMVTSGPSKEEELLYGKDTLRHFRYGDFAVHPDFQGIGLGRAFHMRNIAEAEDRGRLLIWSSCRTNYGFYEKCGSVRVGREIKTCEDIPDDYERGTLYCSVMQAGAARFTFHPI